MSRKKPAPDLIRGGNRFCEKDMLKQSARAHPDSIGSGYALAVSPVFSQRRGLNLHAAVIAAQRVSLLDQARIGAGNAERRRRGQRHRLGPMARHSAR